MVRFLIIRNFYKSAIYNTEVVKVRFFKKSGFLKNITMLKFLYIFTTDRYLGAFICFFFDIVEKKTIHIYNSNNLHKLKFNKLN